jgi:hypothetical protein
MKTKKINPALNKQLYNSFKDVCAEDEIEKTIKDSFKAFSFFQNDILYRKAGEDG